MPDKFIWKLARMQRGWGKVWVCFCADGTRRLSALPQASIPTTDMIILEEDEGHKPGKAGAQPAQSTSTLESEPAPPPYEYEPPAINLSQQDSEALADAAQFQHTRATSTRRRRFMRFLLVAVTLVVAFTLIRSFAHASRGGGRGRDGGGGRRKGDGAGRNGRRRADAGPSVRYV
ncbi:hypothetical protein FB451DRAFT_1208690 [Mycena latifolia]|nr:hypothetical protein FB451DRAFT_1208690 [Mycena latifolia]